jgi:hypothetical protein
MGKFEGRRELGDFLIVVGGIVLNMSQRVCLEVVDWINLA